MDNLTLEPVKESDIPALTQLLTEATKYKSALGDNAWGNEAWSEGEVKYMTDEGNTYVVKQGETIIATVTIQWEDERAWGARPPDAGYIHRLAVKEGYHGQDIGEKVIHLAARLAVEKGRSYLRLDCEADNAKLCSYYEKLGFKRIGTKSTEDGSYSAALYERAIS